MAIKISGTTVIDDSRNADLRRVFVGSYATGSLPSAVEGDVVYDSTEKKLKVYNGSAWV
tara:strand:- start:314 stop:490 length:177 start_codon:yes stop_codon:yes gene_type:complete